MLYPVTRGHQSQRLHARARAAHMAYAVVGRIPPLTVAPAEPSAPVRGCVMG